MSLRSDQPLLHSPADVDYTEVVSREVTFSSGQSASNLSTSCTNLDISNDNALEDQERFTVSLASTFSAVLLTSDRQETAVLIDEDPSDGML